MHRPAREHLCPWDIVVGRLGPADGKVHTYTDENDQDRG
jgi:hypothetical protein